MCLAIPMKLIEIRSARAGIVDLDGIRQEVDLALVDDPCVGDYLIVHAGCAIEKLDPERADEILALFATLREEAAT